MTGAAGGLGYAIASKLAKMGYRVVMVDLKEDVDDRAREISNSTGSYCIGRVTDVSDFLAVKNLASSLDHVENFSKLDVIVNNAGVNLDSLFENMSYEQWDRVLKVDLYSMFNVTKNLLPKMIENGHGSIVNISSMSWMGNVGQANYAAAKAGVIGFTKTLSKELARHKITVNAICPGFIDTPMTRAVPEKYRTRFIERIPLRRVGEPLDVANLVGFLVSEEAAYITGEVINVSGGLVM